MCPEKWIRANFPSNLAAFQWQGRMASVRFENRLLRHKAQALMPRTENVSTSRSRILGCPLDPLSHRSRASREKTIVAGRPPGIAVVAGADRSEGTPHSCDTETSPNAIDCKQTLRNSRPKIPFDASLWECVVSNVTISG